MYLARKGLLVLATCFIACLMAFTPSADAATDSRPFAPVQDGFTADAAHVLPYVQGSLMVKFTPQAMSKGLSGVPFQKGAVVAAAATGLSSVDALAKAAGASALERPFIQPKNLAMARDLGTDRWFRYQVADGDMEELAARFAADPSVEVAQPEWLAFPAAVPNDPLYADHWGHNNTAQMISYDWATYSHTGPAVGTVGFDANAEAAWSTSYGSPGVIVAIIDTGVDIYHEDLNCMAGYDFGNLDTNPMDDSRSAGHGTCCAGVAAAVANNGTGIVGIAGSCTIMPLKVADRKGNMSFTSITNALYYAGDNGADIVSMSIGAVISTDAATDAAILYAYNSGCTLLAATGNENNSVINYPAINQYVIGVGAASPCGDRKRSSSLSTELNPGVLADPNGYTCDGERWWGSNYGPAAQDDRGAVDVIAPTIVPTTDISGSAGYDAGNYDMFFNGTSCATPYAAGVAALIKSAYPSYTPAQVRERLCDTAQDIVNVESGSGWDKYSGYGMVDAAAAVGGGGSVLNPPVAAFSGTPVSGDYPLTVTFTDASTNAPTSWSWNFGDGGTSTAQNPGHIYTAPGAYTVALTATNGDGSDTEIKTGYITVTEPGTGGDSIHVADIVVTRVLSGRKYYGRAVVTIVDDGGAPVSAATVTGLLTGDANATLSGVTGTDGKVTLTAPTKTNGNTDYCFEVTNVTHATLSYDAGANLVTKSCEGGDVFKADEGRVVQGAARLMQNSPNPFNPVTDIAFSLRSDSAVRLTVYDLSGKVVDVLVDGTLSAGFHTRSWDAGNRASGVYFYRLETDGFVETRKMIMLK